MTLLRVKIAAMEPQEFFTFIELHVCVNSREILSIATDMYVTMGCHCLAVELQNISRSCQQYKIS